MEEKKIIQRWNELPFLYRVQIWAYLLCGICSAICYPLTTKLIYSSVETETLASRLVLSSIIGITLSLLWLNIQEKLYNFLYSDENCLCLQRKHIHFKECIETIATSQENKKKYIKNNKNQE